MLCPECKRPCAGGSFCPTCHNQVPEQEKFRGQGGHYLRVLAGFAFFVLVVVVLATGGFRGFRVTLSGLYSTGGLWLLLPVFLLPLVVGLYYWYILRKEEVVVTDEYIARRSHWGDEQVYWRDVTGFYRQPILFRQTRLGAVAWLSRLFRRSQVFLRLPKVSYEIVAQRPDAPAYRMRLEPGTIEDMPWLLRLVSERIGPPHDA